MVEVDLNSDLGESFGAYKIGNDEAVLKYVTSANIACGFHGGDPLVMQKTVALALKNGCALGAHPGLPDLIGFGRRQMTISPDEAYSMVLYQIGALKAFATAKGAKLQHVKPHGALYNMAAKNHDLALAIAAAVYDADKKLILFGLAGSELIKAGKEKNLATASEVFADRSYQADGSLTPRSQPGAMIETEAAAIQQVLGMVKDGKVTSLIGETVTVRADTICVHGDGPKALAFTSQLKEALKREGIAIKSFV